VRVTPEFPGVGNDFERLYFRARPIPTTFLPRRDQPRLKWLPVHGSDGEGGWYFREPELDGSPEVFRLALEHGTANHCGYRAKDWLIGMNRSSLGLSRASGSPDVILAGRPCTASAGLSLVRSTTTGSERSRPLAASGAGAHAVLRRGIRGKSWSINLDRPRPHAQRRLDCQGDTRLSFD